VHVSGLYNFHLCSTLQSAKDPLPGAARVALCGVLFSVVVAVNAARRIVLVVGYARGYLWPIPAKDYHKALKLECS
jgi:hypothetical protein